MERDIVQFVPFRDYASNPIELAKKTLEEIPRQLTSYMNSKHIAPQRSLVPYPGGFNFSLAQRVAFVQTMLGMGFTDEKIQEVLGKGLPEHSIDLFRTHAMNPYYRNPLSELNAPYKSLLPPSPPA
jgi:hypothetical protein